MSSYNPEDLIVTFNGKDISSHSPESIVEIGGCRRGKIELTGEVTFTIDNIEYVCKGFDENGDILFEEKE